MAESITLLDLSRQIKNAIAQGLPSTYWVRAEISEGRQNANGHYYCKFIEKNEAGQDVASASGVIWAGTFMGIKARFERETGQAFTAGIKVLVNVKVNFHERYGLSLVVNAIDPSYTLGDMVRVRKMILARLEKEGIARQNQLIPLPRPLLRIAIITSPTAAGYGDFCNHLEESGAGFKFVTKLFPAVMQGNGVETSIIDALRQISMEYPNWDAVAIIRGGGAVSDFNGFETYPLAAAVASFKLPVITGIGHERDETVLDLVANIRCKTPTAVADFLVAGAQRELDALNVLSTRMHRASINVLAVWKERFAAYSSRLAPAFSNSLAVWKERFAALSTRLVPTFTNALEVRKTMLNNLLLRIPGAVHSVCLREDSRRQKLAMRMEMLAKSATRQQSSELVRKTDRLARATQLLLRTERLRIDTASKSIRLAGPERVFSLGFSLTTVNGKAVRDASQLKTGDVITTQFANGQAQSRVENINVNKEQ